MLKVLSLAVATGLLLTGCSAESGPSTATISGCKQAVVTFDNMFSAIQAAANGGEDSAFHKDEVARLAAKLRSLSLSIDDQALSEDIRNTGDSYSEFIALARAGDEAGANAAIDRTSGSMWYEYCNTLE